MKTLKFGFTIIILLFLLWLCIDHFWGYKVLKVIDGDTLYVDLNRNNRAETEEKIRIKSIDTFETKYSYQLSKQSRNFGITKKQALGLGYLGKEFAKKKLLNKRVKLQIEGKGDFNRKLAHIYINGKNYEKLILKEGLATVYKRADDAEKYLQYENTDKIKQNAQKVQNLDLVILNLKNNKYHKPYCKYARNISRFELVEKKNLSQNAKEAGCCEKLKDYKSSKFDEKIFLKDLEKNKAEMFFVNPVNVKYSENSCLNSVCGSLLTLIKSAHKSIDIAAYGYYGQDDIINALRAAKQRGVKIRGVVDDTTYKFYLDTKKVQSEFGFKQDFFTPIGSGKKFKSKFTRETSALMHNKFAIIDNKYLWTGSTNITDSGMTKNANNSIVFYSSDISNIYLQEFNQMYTNNKFHSLKDKILNAKNIKLKKDFDISIYFSPKDKALRNAVIPLINESTETIEIMIFYLTNKKVVKALEDAHFRGVKVRIIMDFEPTAEIYSPIDRLRKLGVLVKAENWAGKMHMKTAIFDRKKVVLGSTNWTSTAEYVNDENLLVIKNPVITTKVYNEFERLWNSIPDKYLKIKASKKYFKKK